MSKLEQILGLKSKRMTDSKSIPMSYVVSLRPAAAGESFMFHVVIGMYSIMFFCSLLEIIKMVKRCCIPAHMQRRYTLHLRPQRGDSVALGMSGGVDSAVVCIHYHPSSFPDHVTVCIVLVCFHVKGTRV